MRRSEAKRLEQLWAEDFGNAYVERNAQTQDQREAFWRQLLTDHPVDRVLEVGCNIGGNLQWISQCVPPQHVYGIDINLTALQKLRKQQPQVNVLWSPARELPFRDGWFDLSFTAGVLIHQPEVTLPLVMSEVVRTSRRYVLCLEYFSEQTVEVPYRGQEGALFKRDYGSLYGELFPELQLLAQGHLGHDEGWDDVVWWLFEKQLRS